MFDKDRLYVRSHLVCCFVNDLFILQRDRMTWISNSNDCFRKLKMFVQRF